MQNGFHFQHNFISEAGCDNILKSIANYQVHHKVPEIYRAVKGRSLHYSVIDGLKIEQHLPDIAQLYKKVNQVVNEWGGEKLYPLDNKRVGVNVNITPIGGAYRWHYDRNKFTAILYLNDVEEGGETELYIKYRIYSKWSTLQKILDQFLMLKPIRKLFGKHKIIKPQKGALLLMYGNNSLHSVRPLIRLKKGESARINIIMAYDEVHKEHQVSEQLDDYLYREEKSFTDRKADPNYK